MSDQTLEVETLTITVEIELVPAILDDIRELDRYKELANEEFKPVYKLRENLPFWLKRSSDQKIENHVYFLSNNSNKKEVFEWLNAGQIYIHKSFTK